MEARNSRLLRYYYNIDEIAVCKLRCMEKAAFDMDKIRMLVSVSRRLASPARWHWAERMGEQNGQFCQKNMAP